MYKEFIENEKYPRKNAEIADTHDSFKSCGWIIEENELIVDIDNLSKKKIEKLISLFNIQTQTVWTTRGAHFYFKKPQSFRGSKAVCPLGFEVEYKHTKNTNAVTIKQNGELRIIENEGIREDLPEFFRTRRRLTSLLGMDEGEGRNQALFTHRMKIADLKQWQSILRFINNHVLAEPLPEEEFQQISRDVKPEAKKNQEPEIADFILSRYRAISYLGRLYWYEDGQYVTDEDMLKRLVFNEVGLQKTRYVDEVIKQMKYRAPITVGDKTFDIKLRNGILRDGKFHELDYKEFTPYSIDIPYDEKTKPVEIVDEYIEHLTGGEPEYKELLFEILAHPLITNKRFKRMLAKFFIFVGGGGNGKGTLLLIVREILGQKNCSGLSIKQMEDERYFGTLQTKLVNLGDDVQDQAINHEQMKILKNISTCDYVATRNLFEMSKEVELTLSLIFTSNHILKSFEKSEAYSRRVVWLPIYAKPAKKDKNFIDKLTTPEALQYWMKLIVEGYFRVYQNQGFTESPNVKEFNDQYHIMNNNIIEFLEDFSWDHFEGKTSPEAYGEYTTWAEESGLNLLSNKLFQEVILKIHKLKVKKTTRNGKSIRLYMLEDE